MEAQPIVIEQIFHTPLSKLWNALTDHKEMKQWYFDIDNFQAEPGFEFQFYASNEDKTYLHLCKIIEVISGKKLNYRWRYQNFPGDSIVTFELFEEGENTRLKLSHTGVETFPQNLKDFSRESFTAGWTYITGTSLKKYLEA